MRAASLPPRSGPAAADSSSTTGLGTVRRRPPGDAIPSLPVARSRGPACWPGDFFAWRDRGRGSSSSWMGSSIHVSSGTQVSAARAAAPSPEPAARATASRQTSEAEGPSPGAWPSTLAPRRATLPHVLGVRAGAGGPSLLRRTFAVRAIPPGWGVLRPGRAGRAMPPAWSSRRGRAGRAGRAVSPVWSSRRGRAGRSGRAMPPGWSSRRGRAGRAIPPAGASRRARAGRAMPPAGASRRGRPVRAIPPAPSRCRATPFPLAPADERRAGVPGASVRLDPLGAPVAELRDVPGWAFLRPWPPPSEVRRRGGEAGTTVDPTGRRDEAPHPFGGAGPRRHDYSGDVLLSQGESPQVPSALAALTSVFGMGTGVTPPLWPPETLLSCHPDGRAGEAGSHLVVAPL